MRSLFSVIFGCLALVACQPTNRPPVIVDRVVSLQAATVSSSDARVKPCAPVRLWVTAFDPEATQLKYQFTSDPPGLMGQRSDLADSATWLPNPAPVVDTVYSFVVSVEDAQGLIVQSESRSITVQGNGGTPVYCGRIAGRVIQGTRYATFGLAASSQFVVDEALVKWKAAPKASVQSVADNTAVVLRRAAPKASVLSLGQDDARFVRADSGAGNDTLAWIEALRARDDVEYAEPNYKLEPLLTPNDALYVSNAAKNQRWNLEQLNLPNTWANSTGAGVTVAVVDTGILFKAGDATRQHPDFLCEVAPGKPKVLPGWDFVRGDNDPFDDDGSVFHGTHVSGIAAACSNNNVGVAGVAWNAQLLPIRALSSTSGTVDNLARAIRWAVGLPVAGTTTNANPAQVINLSLGSRTPTPASATVQDAIDAAIATGAVVVVAAGNGDPSTGEGLEASLFTPANQARVVVVGALGPDKAKTKYSNFGNAVTVVAPGGNRNYAGKFEDMVLSTVGCDEAASGTGTGTAPPCANGWGYGYLQGTSMAAPHVAGLVALMVGANDKLRVPTQYNLDPGFNWLRVSRLLRASSGFSGLSNCVKGCGAGLPDAQTAVAAAVASTGVVGAYLETTDLKNAALGFVNLGASQTSGVVRVRNVGDSATTVTASAAGAGLSVVGGNGFYLGAGAYVDVTYQLNRAGLAGSYSGLLRFTESAGTSKEVRVNYQNGIAYFSDTSNVRVRLYKCASTDCKTTTQRQNYPGLLVDAQGNFEFTNLPGGEYKITGYRSVSTNPNGTVKVDVLGERFPIVVSGEDRVNQFVTLEPNPQTVCSETGSVAGGPSACP